MTIVNLPANCSCKQWRAQAKKLIQSGVHPKHVEWYSVDSEPDLFSESTPASGSTTADDQFSGVPDSQNSMATDSATVMVPAEFIRRSKLAMCHASADKFGLLYRILWRLSHNERYLLDLAMDADVKKLNMFCKAVRRDLHKMTAFVRFDCCSPAKNSPQYIDTAANAEISADANTKTNIETDCQTEPVYYAWFEPEHHVLPLAAEFFKKRFSNTVWTIATPIGSIFWDKAQLTVDYNLIPEKPETHDGVVALWDTYYASIFNPGRMKLNAMNAEMPRKYWRNMPETNQISALVSEAPVRKQSMLSAEPSTPPRWARKINATKSQSKN